MRVPAGSIRNAIFSPMRRHVAERRLEGDAVGRELLAERLQVLHFETDVIERPALRRGLRRVRLAKTERHPGHAGGVRIRRRRHRRAEVFHVPGAKRVRIGRVEVHVEVLQRDAQRRSGVELHLHLVRKDRHDLRRIIARERNPGGLEFRTRGRKVLRAKREMVDRGSFRTLGGLRFPQNQKDSGQLQELERHGCSRPARRGRRPRSSCGPPGPAPSCACARRTRPRHWEPAAAPERARPKSGTRRERSASAWFTPVETRAQRCASRTTRRAPASRGRDPRTTA